MEKQKEERKNLNGKEGTAMEENLKLTGPAKLNLR